jgi:riboflavin synthase
MVSAVYKALVYGVGLCSVASLSGTKNWPHKATTSSPAKMFSGIIEDMGVVDSLVTNKAMPMWDGSIGEGVELTVRSKIALEDGAYIGCSIAVNGVCLTVTSFDEESFTVGLAEETLSRSNLGLLGQQSKVNVERALRADGRNSGHNVQGHVDGTGRVAERWMDGSALWVKVAVTPGLIKYIVEKGFICIDGTS